MTHKQLEIWSKIKIIDHNFQSEKNLFIAIKIMQVLMYKCIPFHSTCTEFGSRTSDGKVKDPTTILLTLPPPIPGVGPGVGVSFPAGLLADGGGRTTTWTTLP